MSTISVQLAGNRNVALVLLNKEGNSLLSLTILIVHKSLNLESVKTNLQMQS